MAWLAMRPCCSGVPKQRWPAHCAQQPGWPRAEPALTPLRFVQQPHTWPGLPQRCRGSAAGRPSLHAAALCCTALLALRAAPSAAGRLGQRAAGRSCAAVQALSAAAVPSFQVLRVPGDGSCLFRALAQGRSVLERRRPLERDELMREGYQLRQDVCEALLARRQELEPFIVGRFDVYVDNMMREGSWGGEPELAVAAYVLKRPVLVYKRVQSGLFGLDLEKVSEYGIDKASTMAPVCLLYSGNHYDLLLVSK